MSNKNTTDKRIESTKQYIDKLSENHSKLNIVRVDLGYKKPYSDNTTLEEANNDLKRMFNNMRSKPSIFKDKVGYICKREYTKDKGVHFHTMIIFDGQKVQKDAFKGKQIGEYWNQITEDKGSYFNCNHQKSNYKHLGIGMLDHTDKKKRKIVDDMVTVYLCKDDDKQDIKTIQKHKKDRAFTRGTTPKSKGNLGRPRA